MKNIVVMPNFKDYLPKEDKVSVKNSRIIWEAWCKKFNYELLVIEEPICSYDTIRVEMQKMWVMDILESNDVEYDQVLVVDYDTYPMPNCPDVFQMTDHKFSAALDNGFGPQLSRSMIMYRDHWFPHITFKMLNWDNYLNGGILIYNKEHKILFKTIQQWFNDNFKSVDIINNDMENSQTIMNFLIVDLKIPVSILPRSFNVLDFHMERFLIAPYKDDRGRMIDRERNILECVNIFHITNGQIRDQASQYLKEVIWKL